MSETAYGRMDDGATLRVLDSGLEIIRRIKHEPIDLANLTAEQIVQRTDKRHGSKFTSDWTLADLVDWIAQEVLAEKWALDPGVPSRRDCVFARVVGLVAGEPTYTIRIVSDGRYIHAYPVRDE